MRRFMRPLIVGLVLLILLALPVTAVLARSYFLSPTWQPAAEQPIAFPHTRHAQVAQLDCEYCHRGVAEDGYAGMPALELCMDCHQSIQTGSAEIDTLIDYFENGDPVNWERVHQMPDHVHFVHSSHVNYGFDCAECHGDMETEIDYAEQVRDLRMGDCIDCHKEYGAPTDCSVCHY
ncbi:MAG: molecular chaperone [Sphaerobacteraceae bacterium]|nr:MAG: molecular chaperone [Sphaerobacteraceae bacterium]